MRKLCCKKGETLAETLVSVLIIALSSALLSSIISAASRLSSQNTAADAQFYEEWSAAEMGREAEEGTITIQADGYLPQSAAVMVSGGNGALTSYTYYTYQPGKRAP